VTPRTLFSQLSRFCRGTLKYYSNTPFQSSGSLTVKVVCKKVSNVELLRRFCCSLFGSFDLLLGNCHDTIFAVLIRCALPCSRSHPLLLMGFVAAIAIGTELRFLYAVHCLVYVHLVMPSLGYHTTSLCWIFLLFGWCFACADDSCYLCC